MNAPSQSPGLLTRLAARLSGEVSAETLDAYRRAGLGVYDLLESAEAERAELSAAGASEVPHATRCFLLCTWNAFALQTLGDAFVDADYAAGPRTVGFVPPVTKEQALSFYGEVESWMGHGHGARSNPHAELPMALPAELPAFVEVEPCPREHLQAMLSAARVLGRHAETASLDAERLPGADERQLAELRALLASAANAAAYAERLYGDGSVAQELHERIERSIQEALSGFYLAGQLAAMPDLVGRQPVALSMTGAGAALPGPGEAGFDPWCLTDPHSRDRWKADPRARDAVDLLWEMDPDPRATLDVQAQLVEALRRGYVEYATDSRGERVGNYYCCPWAPILATTRPVTIDGLRLRSGQQLTYDVSAEEMAEGEPFKRELLLGNFTPTDKLDYCNPREGGHAD